MHDPNVDPVLLVFPELPYEAVIAVNDFIETFYNRFQNHYFAQMHRYDHPMPTDTTAKSLCLWTTRRSDPKNMNHRHSRRESRSPMAIINLENQTIRLADRSQLSSD